MGRKESKQNKKTLSVSFCDNVIYNAYTMHVFASMNRIIHCNFANVAMINFFNTFVIGFRYPLLFHSFGYSILQIKIGYLNILRHVDLGIFVFSIGYFCKCLLLSLNLHFS